MSYILGIWIYLNKEMSKFVVLKDQHIKVDAAKSSLSALVVMTQHISYLKLTKGI